MAGGADMDFFNFGVDDLTQGLNGEWSSTDAILDFQRGVDRLNLIGVNQAAVDGMLFLDDQDGTPGEAGEIMFHDFGGNHTLLSIDFDGDGDTNFGILFGGMVYDPNNPFNSGDVII